MINLEQLLSGYINKPRKNGGYSVRFWNQIEGKYDYLGFTPDFEEGYKLYCNKQHEYYKEHHYLVPNHISLDSSGGIFKFAITYKDKFGKKKTSHFFSSKCLQEVVEYKKNFVASLL